MRSTAGAGPPPLLYTVGHSNHSAGSLLALLRPYGIATIADVRSVPHSRRHPAFSKRALEAALAGAGLGYVWLGEALGGRPRDPAVLGPDGAPDYALVAQQPWFTQGLDALLTLATERGPVAILCAEEDPAHCHREHLVATALRSRGVRVEHIRKRPAAAGTLL